MSNIGIKYDYYIDGVGHTSQSSAVLFVKNEDAATFALAEVLGSMYPNVMIELDISEYENLDV